MGLIGSSQLSFIASYSYDAPLPSSDYFTPAALRAAVVTPTGDGAIGEVGVLSVTYILTNASGPVSTGSVTVDRSPLFPTSVPADLTSVRGLVPVFASGQTQTRGFQTAVPGLGLGDIQGENGLDVNAGQPLQPVTPVSTGFFPGLDSFTTGQVQTAGGEGDVSAIPGIGGPLTGTGFTIIKGPSNMPIVQPGTVIGSGQVQTQGSGVFFIETGAAFTIFDAPALTAPITLFDGTRSRIVPGGVATRTVTVTVGALESSLLSITTSVASSGTLKTVSTASSASTTTTLVPEISSAAAAVRRGRGLGFGHTKVLERLAAMVVGWVGFRWID